MSIQEDIEKANQGLEDYESEIVRLRRMVITFKKKYQQVLQEISQKEKTGSSKQADELNAELQEIQEENAALVQQLHFLKELVKEEKEKRSELEAESSKQINILKDEKFEAEKVFSTKNASESNEAKELASLKHALFQSLRENNDIKSRYQIALQEKAVALQKYGQILTQLQDVKGVIHSSEQEKSSAFGKISGLQNEKQQIEKELENEKNRQQQFNAQLEDKENKIMQLSDQLVSLEKKLKHAHDLIKEKDGSVLEAHQHLAKKVKETARQNELIEEQQRQIAKIQEELFESRAKVYEAQKSIENHAQYEKRYQSQLASWEEKYFRTYEKVQELEAQNRELKKIEEKHFQLQQLFANLGSAIGTPISYIQPEAPKHKPVRPIKQEAPRVEISEQPNLFDLPKGETKQKKDLFG